MTPASPVVPVPGAAAAPGRAGRLEAMIFVGVIIVLAIAVILGAGQVAQPAGNTVGLGARVVPYAVGGLMLIAAIAVLIGQLRGNYGEPDGGEDIDLEASTSWVTTGIVVLAFASLIITIPLLGWPLAVTILFTGSALALGAKKWWVALIVGFVLGAVSWLAFGLGLGLSLPATGTWTSWIGI